jgi:hypothetical protein
MSIDLPVSLQPDGFSASLLALQNHLQGFLTEYEDKVAQARAQLAHVEALLSSLPSQPPSIPKTRGRKKEILPTVPPVAPEPVVSVVTEIPPVTKGRKPKIAKVTEVATITPPSKGRGRGRGHRRGSLTMKQSYEGLTLTEAIAKILKERLGQAANADDVVNILYGELDETTFRVAKERVTKNLSKGKGEGIWQRVPGQLGYYTISLSELKVVPTSTVRRGRAATIKPEAVKPTKVKTGKAVKPPKPVKAPKAPKTVAEVKAPRAPKASKELTVPEKTSQTQPKKSGRMSSLIMRPLYQGNTLTDAIEKVLQERKGEFVNADSVVKALYGDLSVENFRQAKDRVTKNLSKGKLDGKWERVPNQLGYYTLSMSAVKA